MTTFTKTTEFVTVTCCYDGCGVQFAFTRAYYELVRNDPKRWWFCPNGHTQHYTAEATDAHKLERAKARETALTDQLNAAVYEAERVRGALLRDRQRLANGVCPCCNRSFENVRRHMTTKHPDYDATRVAQPGMVRFPCSCGRSFDTLRGLRTHQGHSRADGWEKRAQSDYSWERRSAHLTEVGTR